MNSLFKGVLQRKWQNQLILVRYKGKINITRPRPPHFERHIVEQICVPYFNIKKKLPYIPNIDLCAKEVDVVEPLNPLEVIIVRETKELIAKSKLIAFFHVNSLTEEEEFQNKLKLKKIGMEYNLFEKRVMEKIVLGTMYEPVLSLFQSHTSVVYSKDPDISKLLNVSKKLKNIVLMAAVVEDRFLSISQLKFYEAMGNLEQVRANLVGVLNMAAQNVVQQINHHPNNLVQQLNTLKEIKRKNITNG